MFRHLLFLKGVVCLYISFFFLSCSNLQGRNSLEFERYYIRDSGNKLVPKPGLKFLEKALFDRISSRNSKVKINEKDISSLILCCARIYHNIYDEISMFLEKGSSGFELCMLLNKMDESEFLDFATLVFEKSVDDSKNLTKSNRWREAVVKCFSDFNNKVSSKFKSKSDIKVVASMSSSSLLSVKESDSQRNECLSPQKTSVTAFFKKTNSNSLASSICSKRSMSSKNLKSKYIEGSSFNGSKNESEYSNKSGVRRKAVKSMIESSEEDRLKTMSSQQTRDSKKSLLSNSVKSFGMLDSEKKLSNSSFNLEKSKDFGKKDPGLLIDEVCSKKNLKGVFSKRKSAVKDLKIIGYVKPEKGAILPIYEIKK